MGYRVESCVAKDGRARLGGFRTALEITPWNMGSLSDDHPVEVHVEIGVDLLIFGVLYEYLYCVYLYLHLHLHISIFIFIYIYIYMFTRYKYVYVLRTYINAHYLPPYSSLSLYVYNLQ